MDHYDLKPGTKRLLFKRILGIITIYAREFEEKGESQIANVYDFFLYTFCEAILKEEKGREVFNVGGSTMLIIEVIEVIEVIEDG
ncbi:hypothetical protein AB1K84_01110 [Mesobacillus foraminis]|uniref:hypothetical protein n=1 Tax=Mesobacillus foraminis TaxID=279826 RepID=UPI00399F0704